MTRETRADGRATGAAHRGEAGQEPVLVMYSGGLDSTLAATLLAPRCERLLLVTYHVQGAIGTQRSRKNVKLLRELFPRCRIEHRLVDATPTRTRLLASFPEDYFRFCSTGAPGIICLACKMAMLVESVRIARSEGIRQLANGMTSSESDHPECMPSLVNRFADFMEEYGITYINEVYGLPDREEERRLLGERGIDLGIRVGSSDVLRQPRCVLGVYSTLWKARDHLEERDMAAYFDCHRPLLTELVGVAPAPAPPPRGFRVPDTQRLNPTAEFGPVADRLLGLAFSPLWWLSRRLLRVAANRGYRERT